MLNIFVFLYLPIKKKFVRGFQFAIW